jgi:hypothetical protein
MVLTNGQIYSYANALAKAYTNIDSDIHYPIKANFYLQKNKNTMFTLAQEIEAARVEILKRNATVDETTGNYTFKTDDDAKLAMKELEDLFNLEQDVALHLITLEAFGESTLTLAQMEALMFMIED